MGFFDLNIPYNEPSPSNKTNRIRLVIKAMELGYLGIAYNRTIKGVMSEKDRCSISLLTLSSILKLAASLSSAVEFHRDLLGVPRASPFRQYTRLTVCIDSASQAQALNSGNPILKTYNVVAVRPLNQSVFDQACENLEVDIIAIDFSEKLPFRLKLPMVKAAIERGIYFEISYSNLIADVHLRRQMISNSQLLVDWTRGKNLILSSAATSVNELRGPYDVANLSSLLGLSAERAKAAISKNCRTLIANALRKRQFYKETIRVEMTSSGENIDLKEPWSRDWLKWDPITSGEGDLLLDDIAKSFAASSKESKIVKAIDFSSVVDGMPSHGFHISDLISGSESAFLPLSKNQNFPVAKLVDLPNATNRVFEQPCKLDIHPASEKSSFSDAPFIDQSSNSENSQKMSSPSDATKAFVDTEEIKTTSQEIECPKNSIEENLNRSIIDSAFIKMNIPVHSHTLNSAAVLDAPCEYGGTLKYSNLSGNIDFCSQSEDVILQDVSSSEVLADVVLEDVSNRDVLKEASLENSGENKIFSLFEGIDFPCQNEGCKGSKSSDVVPGAENVTMNEALTNEVLKNQEYMSSAVNDASMHEEFLEGEKSRESRDEAIVPNQVSHDVIKVEDDSLIVDQRLSKVIMGEQKPVYSKRNQFSVQSVPGKRKTKRRTHHRVKLFPFKRLLGPIALKKTNRAKCSR